MANVSDINIPYQTDVVDVTASCDTLHRRIATLTDIGPITFKLYYVMEEVSHRNGINGGTVARGLKYMCLHPSSGPADFQFNYPDGNGSTDAVPCYVTKFAITGKVGGVFEAAVELRNSGPGSFV